MITKPKLTVKRKEQSTIHLSSFSFPGKIPPEKKSRRRTFRQWRSVSDCTFSKSSISKKRRASGETVSLKRKLTYMAKNRLQRFILLVIFQIIIIILIIVVVIIVVSSRLEERTMNVTTESSATLSESLELTSKNTTTASSKTVPTTSAPAVLDFAKLCIIEYGQCWFYSPTILDNCSYIPCYSSTISIKYGHISGNEYHLQFTTMTPKQLTSFNLDGQLCYAENRDMGRCRMINETMMCVKADHVIIRPRLTLFGIWELFQSNDNNVCLSFQTSESDLQPVRIPDHELPWTNYDACRLRTENGSSDVYCSIPFKVNVRYCAAPTLNQGAEACFDVNSTVIPWPSYPVQLERCPNPCQLYKNISLSETIDCTGEHAADSLTRICELTITTGPLLNHNDFKACCLPDFLVTGHSRRIYNQTLYTRKMGRCLHGLCVEVLNP